MQRVELLVVCADVDGAAGSQDGRAVHIAAQLHRPAQLSVGLETVQAITEGLVCVLSVVEPCQTFSLVWNGTSPYVQSAKRKCLQLYYYFMDHDLGLIHVKLQTWFPFQIQI